MRQTSFNLKVSMDIDFIIQGPYHPHVLQSVEKYKEYGNIILSCYTSDEVPELPDYVKVIQSPVPYTVNAYNHCNIFFQCYTTLIGLYSSASPYVIKCRTEEIYGNIKPFVDKVLSSKKLITGNVAFPRTSVQPFHPSDHLMGGSRAMMTNLFATCLEICVDKNVMQPFTWQDCLDFIGEPLAETLLCLSYFQSQNVVIPKKPTLAQQRELMIKMFEVIPVEDMSPVTHTIRVPQERRFRKDGEGLYGYPHESIRNINDV